MVKLQDLNWTEVDRSQVVGGTDMSVLLGASSSRMPWSLPSHASGIRPNVSPHMDGHNCPARSRPTRLIPWSQAPSSASGGRRHSSPAWCGRVHFGRLTHDREVHAFAELVQSFERAFYVRPHAGPHSRLIPQAVAGWVANTKLERSMSMT